jgi:hypothetical protein
VTFAADGYPAAAMDFFLASCQGVGLAVACGALAGAPGRRDAIGVALLVVAVVAAELLFAVSLAAEDYDGWPGFILGALIAVGSFFVVSGIAEGAGARAGEGGLTGALIGLAALATAGLTLLLRPLGLVALLAVIYLGIARRQRAARKYEGLRSLR